MPGLEVQNSAEVLQEMDMHDEDGDNLLDTQELKLLDPAFLESIGMPHASVTELLTMFDKNQDRHLDQGEKQGVIGAIVPRLANQIETVRKTQDFHHAKSLQENLVGLKSSMRQNFHEYLEDKKATERSGLYNYTQFAMNKLNKEYAHQVRQSEEHFAERREALDRQFGMRRDVLSCSLEGTRKAGTALVPKPTPLTLELRATLHHLSQQKRFGEAIELQAKIDQLEMQQLEGFDAAQPAFVVRQHKSLQAEYAAASERLERKRAVMLAKLQDQHSKGMQRIKNQSSTYKHRLEHCHALGSQHQAVVGARPVRVPRVPILPNLTHAETLNSEPDRTRGSDGAYQLTLPQLHHQPTGLRRPVHATHSYLVDPMWTRKGLAMGTSVLARDM